MSQIDLKKAMRPFYSPSAKKVELVDVPRLQFIMTSGAIEPGSEPGKSPAFQEAVQAIYNVAYTLKFACKKRKEAPLDYPVMALEGLWWVEDGDFDIRRKDNWVYTLMILQPEAITAEMFGETVRDLRRKKGDLPAFGRLRLESFQEGLCVQTLHIGPYASEPATVEKMEEFAGMHGYRMRGKHHEIYLGDPLRAQPEKLKTILRHPVQPI